MSIISLIKKVFEPTKSFPTISFLVVLQAAIFALISIATAHVIKITVDAIVSGDLSKIVSYMRLLAGIFLIYMINMYTANTNSFNKLGPRVHANRMSRAMNRFFSLDNNVVEKLGTGKIINIIERGVEHWFSRLAELHRSWVLRLTRIIAMCIYAFYLGWIYGVTLFIVSLLILFSHIHLQNKANTWREKRKKEHIEMSRQVVRQIQSKAEVVQSGKQQLESNIYHDFNARIEDYNRNIMVKKFFGDGFAKLLLDGLRVLTIIAAGYGLFSSQISLGTFVVLMTLYGSIEGNSYQLSRLYIYATNHYIHVQKLCDLFGNPEDIVDNESGEIFIYKKGQITLTDVTFGYEGAPVFSHFDITISGGKRTAFVGLSGSGKSTLIKLIAGYIRPNSGLISVDGQDFSTLSLKSYYQHIGYLTQDPSIFDGTIIDNLLYAADSAISKEKMREVLSLAKCDFVRDFEDGLETEIGERGVRLSGGQRQRLAIAKIFLKDPKIIILDEPTSALDSFSEEAITQAMQNLFENRTVLIIAHRLQTVKNADDIVVIDAGKVIERGTHERLLSEGGFYAKMLELQSGF